MKIFAKICRYLPRTTIGEDTLAGDFGNRYSPIPVDRMRVSIPVKKKILGQRSFNHPGISFRDDARLTVVIPYRDRAEHLVELIPVLKRVLLEQNIKHNIVVVEQESGKLFNRGLLKNIGAHYLFEQSDYFCFHDVDNLPISANYSCPSCPLRLIKSFETTWRKSQSLGGGNFGGVVSLNKQDFMNANGYTNNFWGWGKEDDELFLRLVLSGLIPFEDKEGVFRELPNPSAQKRNSGIARKNKRIKDRLQRGFEDYMDEGFSSLKYELLSIDETADFTKITVRI